MVICVTGKIGSGKSTVCKFLSEITGFPVIDVDKIGHEVLKDPEVVENVRKVFGYGVISGGEVNRTALRKIVFRSKENLKKLESIVHPLMVRRVKEIVRENENVIVDCALLERMGLKPICDCIIYVESSYENARKRKPHLSDDEFERIWSEQSDVRRIGHVIVNDGNIEDLKRAVESLIKEIQGCGRKYL